MEINSTAKMLANMAGTKKSESVHVSDIEDTEPLSCPKLKPSSDMEQVLNNILGSSLSKKPNPMD